MLYNQLLEEDSGVILNGFCFLEVLRQVWWFNWTFLQFIFQI